MNSKEPAFPVNGITVRDYFAALAMQSAMTDVSIPWFELDIREIKLWTAAAYAVADAMMAAREAPK